MKIRMTRESVAHFQGILNDHKFTRSVLEQWFKENMPENWHFGRLTISEGIGTIEIIDIQDGVSCAKLKAQLLPWGMEEKMTMTTEPKTHVKPDSLILGIQTVKVVYVKDITSTSGESLAGQTDYDNNILKIDASLNSSNLRITLMRSIVNNAARLAGFKMGEKNEKEFTAWLVCSFLTNPQIVEMLRE